ncbi:thermonuclease family protein [Pasteurella multocida]
MYKKLALITLCCLCFTHCSQASRSIPCQVIGITDGDTLTCLLQNKKSLRVRLAEIDAPEKNQPFGTKSKQFLTKLVYKKPVQLRILGKDHYQRTLAVVYNAQHENMNIEMVKSGMAWAYPRYNHDPMYLRAQQAAMKARLGLWQDTPPIPPEQWRRQKRK